MFAMGDGSESSCSFEARSQRSRFGFQLDDAFHGCFHVSIHGIDSGVWPFH